MTRSLLLICLPLAVAFGPARRVNIRKSDKSWVQIKTNTAVGVDAGSKATMGNAQKSSTNAALWKNIIQELEKRKKLLPRTEVKTKTVASGGAKVHTDTLRADVHANAKAHTTAGTVHLATSNKESTYWSNIRKGLEQQKKTMPKAPSQVHHANTEPEKSHKHDSTHRPYMIDAKADTLAVPDSTRRELLWHSLSSFGAVLLGTKCQIASHVTYPDVSDTIYTRTAVPSALECSLMCAVDSVRGGGGKSCQSFVHNKTAKECHFMASAPSGREPLRVDGCCSSGLPCRLHGLQQKIQHAYEMKLRSKIQAGQIKHEASELIETVRKSELVVAAQDLSHSHRFADLTEGARVVSSQPSSIHPKTPVINNLSRRSSVSISQCIIVGFLIVVALAIILHFEDVFTSSLGGAAEKYVKSHTAVMKLKFEELGDRITKTLHQVAEPFASKVKQMPQAFTGLSEQSKEFCATQSQRAHVKFVQFGESLREVPGKLFTALLALRARV